MHGKDVETNCKMLRMLLRKEGVLSEVAENGQIAVDLVLSDVDKYSLLLMDNQMPVVVGSTIIVLYQYFDFNWDLLLEWS